MDVANIDKAKERFEILQTGECSQTAVVTLSPGDSSGAKVEAHEKSDQVLFMLEGELNGEVGYEYPSLKKGDVNIIFGRGEALLHQSVRGARRDV